MNAARILLLCVALAAGGAATFLARNGEEKKSEAPVVHFVATDALIAKSDIAKSDIAKRDIAKRDVDVATALSNQYLQWQARLSATTGGSGISNNT